MYKEKTTQRSSNDAKMRFNNTVTNVHLKENDITVKL